MPSQRGPRAYVSEFTINVGPVNVLGRLIPITKTGSDDYNKATSVCPDCPSPTKPQQGYTCPEGHGPYPIGELLKAKTLEDGSLAFVSKEELEAARASDLPLNHFRATVHPVDQVADATFDSDNAYVFVPRNYDEYHALLVRLVDESGFAFIAMTNLRNREGFYRLAKWQDHLVVQRLYWPDECNEFEAPEIGCDNATFNAATGMIQRIAQPFDADAYRSSVKERMLELAATLDPDAPRPEVSEQRPAPAPTEDLQAILNAFGPEPSTPQRASA